MDKDQELFKAAPRRSVHDMQAGASARTKNGPRPVHPGEVLREDFLEPLGINANTLAKAIHVALSVVEDLANERRALTAELALRLARYFGGDADSWMNLQQAYDLAVARRAHGPRIEAEVTPRKED